MTTALEPNRSKIHRKILDWLHRTPNDVDRLTLDACGTPDHVLMALDAAEAQKLDPSVLAAQLEAQAVEWVDGCDREGRFVCQWWKGQAPVLTLTFRMGDSYGGSQSANGMSFDGSYPDMMGQLQRHLEATQRTMVGSMKQVMDAQNFVIERQSQELEGMRAQMVAVTDREKEIATDELSQIIDQQDEDKLARLLTLGIEAYKQVKAATPAAATTTTTGNNTKH